MSSQDKAFTKGGNLKKADIVMIAQWVKESGQKFLRILLDIHLRNAASAILGMSMKVFLCTKTIQTNLALIVMLKITCTQT